MRESTLFLFYFEFEQKLNFKNNQTVHFFNFHGKDPA